MQLSQLLFTFDGRINRARYWIGFGILFLIAAATSILEAGLGQAVHPFAGWLVGIVIGLISIIPSFAITMKRLHDRDMSGWWMFIHVTPFPIGLLGSLLESGVLFFLGVLLMIGLTIWLFVQVGCLRGTVGPNRFGPDPLEPRAGLSLSAAE